MSVADTTHEPRTRNKKHTTKSCNKWKYLSQKGIQKGLIRDVGK
jgi:hypothetical protein